MTPRIFKVYPGDLPYETEKRADERLDFTMDWSREIPVGDQIASSSWEVGDGLTQPYAASITGLQTKCWLAGGTVGQVVRVINRITTAANRILVRSFTVRIVLP